MEVMSSSMRVAVHSNKISSIGPIGCHISDYEEEVNAMIGCNGVALKWRMKSCVEFGISLAKD